MTITYDRQYGFTAYSVAYPNAPLPGIKLDIELNAVKLAIDSLVDGVRFVYDGANGKVASGIITLDSLSIPVRTLLNSNFVHRGYWETDVEYFPSDMVIADGSSYTCFAAHRSGRFYDDREGEKWGLVGPTNAAAIPFAPTGAFLSNNVQDAISEALSIAMSAISGTGQSLTALASLIPLAGTIPYFTSSAVATTVALTPWGKARIADSDATSLRAAIGLSSATEAISTLGLGECAKPAITIQGAGTGALLREDGDGSELSNLTFPPGLRWGLRLSNASGDTDHDILVQPGMAISSTNDENMVLKTARTKRIDAIYAVGDAAGGLDTGTVAANKWYAVHLIKNTSTGVVDVTFSLSATSPVLGGGATRFRRIGWVLTDDNANIMAFKQFGRQFYYAAPPLDSTTLPAVWPGTAVTVSCPPDTTGRFVIKISPTGGDTGGLGGLAPTWASADWPYLAISRSVSGSDPEASGSAQIPADASRQIKAFKTSTIDLFNIWTTGWEDDLGMTTP